MSFPTATNSGPVLSTNSPRPITNRSSAATTSSRPSPLSIAEERFTFLVENRESTGEEVEQNVENLCLTCERLKPSLVEQWNGRK